MLTAPIENPSAPAVSGVSAGIRSTKNHRHESALSFGGGKTVGDPTTPACGASTNDHDNRKSATTSSGSLARDRRSGELRLSRQSSWRWFVDYPIASASMAR